MGQNGGYWTRSEGQDLDTSDPEWEWRVNGEGHWHAGNYEHAQWLAAKLDAESPGYAPHKIVRWRRAGEPQDVPREGPKP